MQTSTRADPNNAQVLARITESAHAECMAKYKLVDDLLHKRVMGMALDFAPDVFCFEVKPLNKPMQSGACYQN